MVLIISDLHFDSNDPYDLNRLKFEIFEDLITRPYEAIYDCGDFLNKKNYDLDLLMKLVSIFEKSNTPYFMNIGNHDFYQAKYHPLEPYIIAKPNIHLIKEFTQTEYGDCVGLVEKELNFKRKSDYLFGHFKIKDWIIETGVEIKNISKLGYKNVFVGDTHKEIEDRGVVSVGTLFPSYFGDKNQQSTYIELDYDNDSWERKYNNYPVFREFRIRESDQSWDIDRKLVEGNIVRLDLVGSVQWLFEKRDLLRDFVKEMNPYYLQVNERAEKDTEKVEFKDQSLKEYIKEYAKKNNWSRSQVQIVESYYEAN